METDMETALPSNVQDLYDALVMAEHSEGILPPTLADDPSMNSRNIRPYMWQQADKTADTQSTRTSTQPSDRSVADKHRRMLELVKLSNESFDLHRSEAAWNTIVHYPLLSELTSFSSDLEALIKTFTNSSPTATVNQTAYYPLKTRPAPVFIETKTSAGNIEAAKVQLGVWIAAWHESIRSIMRRGGDEERIITVPIIQVVNGTWILMFAVDAQTEIHILDRDFRIGNSSTIYGMYQLQAALSVIVVWIEGEFKAWITRVLRKALS
ncbi:hypothetical protein BGZ61DRAFT_590981 [Ilyonectria robusta]|uniref:uncharacterized protein n=1 Tax=Ilyonectria robusta TaxID=1079257 RepID=UPI001E8DD558|nr:uncharacterized protein BGZ61DRAFT_590981 [Ilyonectria robusta]KAH8676927.1 hypothetical protein BGZ61DRAFT_590981 [Ilyonectria robusta]